MKTVVASIGIPGSGKTTVLKSYAAETGSAYICPDDIREELTGSATDHSKNSEAWEEAYRRMAGALGREEDVVFDATLAKPIDRQGFAARARNAGAERIVGVYFDVTLAVAFERNRMRTRMVPDYAIERMHKALQEQPPSEQDGFDAIIAPSELQ